MITLSFHYYDDEYTSFAQQAPMHMFLMSNYVELIDMMGGRDEPYSSEEGRYLLNTGKNKTPYFLDEREYKRLRKELEIWMEMWPKPADTTVEIQG